MGRLCKLLSRYHLHIYNLCVSFTHWLDDQPLEGCSKMQIPVTQMQAIDFDSVFLGSGAMEKDKHVLISPQDQSSASCLSKSSVYVVLKALAFSCIVNWACR